MEIEHARFVNLEKFRWKCADDLGISIENVSDKVYSKWLMPEAKSPDKYYSHWKNQLKKMSPKKARALEERIGIPNGVLDILHIGDDLFTSLMKDCFHMVRVFMVKNSINIDAKVERNIAEKLFDDAKANGMLISEPLFKNLVSVYL